MYFLVKTSQEVREENKGREPLSYVNLTPKQNPCCSEKMCSIMTVDSVDKAQADCGINISASNLGWTKF